MNMLVMCVTNGKRRIEKMTTEDKKYNEKCNPQCILHECYTHNTCWSCNAVRNSPHLQEEVKNMTDEEIEKARKEIAEESQM